MERKSFERINDFNQNRSCKPFFLRHTFRCKCVESAMCLCATVHKDRQLKIAANLSVQLNATNIEQTNINDSRTTSATKHWTCSVDQVFLLSCVPISRFYCICVARSRPHTFILQSNACKSILMVVIKTIEIHTIKRHKNALLVLWEMSSNSNTVCA